MCSLLVVDGNLVVAVPDATVTTTGDDGTEATTSGDQVTEVPEGSGELR